MIVWKNHLIFKNNGYDLNQQHYDFDKAFLKQNEIYRQMPELTPRLESTYRLEDHVYDLDSIETLWQLRQEGETGEIIILNFANTLQPGGGYLNGAKAQEEDLCRCSFLFQTLVRKYFSFYAKNLFLYTPYGRHDCLVSPNVPVFRRSNYELAPYTTATFLTVPAVDVTILKYTTLNLYNRSKIQRVMEERMKFLLAVALERKPAAIVLGAWGCGNYGNNREFVLSTFESLIQQYVDTTQTHVVFALPMNKKKRDLDSHKVSFG